MTDPVIPSENPAPNPPLKEARFIGGPLEGCIYHGMSFPSRYFHESSRTLPSGRVEKSVWVYELTSGPTPLVFELEYVATSR